MKKIMSTSEERLSTSIAELHEDEVKVFTNDATGLYITFDQASIVSRTICFCNTLQSSIEQILKRDIHWPELRNVKVSKMRDYPPTIKIYVQPASNMSLHELRVTGLDRECRFNIMPYSCKL